MEIRHTVEILTKDIQDIEKLVRNFNNYPSPPKIEIDLAMSKLRNVYDLLSMIAADFTTDLSNKEDVEREILEDNQRGNSVIPEETTAPVEEEFPEPPVEPLRNEVTTINEPEKKPSPEKISTPVNEDTRKEDNKEELSEPVDEPMPSPAKEVHKKASILAEKFAADKSINERIASKTNEEQKTRVSGDAIDSIRRNIGINDRFMIIRELLNGKNDVYIQFIEKLDQAENLQEALAQIEEQFRDNPDHNGVKILVGLVRRKFLNQ